MAITPLDSACQLAHVKAQGNCSGAVRIIAHEMGVELPDYDANHLIDYFNDSAQGWVAISAQDAQDAADSDRLVVAGKKATPNGHVVVVMPGRMKASGGYQYTDRKTGKLQTAANHGTYPRSCSTAKGGWPGGISKGEKTVFDAWGNMDAYAGVKYWTPHLRDRWIDPELELSAGARSCFTLAPRPELVPLPVNTIIYWLRTNVTDREFKTVSGSAIEESPWWFPKETYDAIIRSATKARGNMSGVARVGLAVPPRFNRDFDTLVSVTLRSSGFAYRGLASPQSYGKDADFYLPGGMVQLWIPGLLARDFRFNFFGSINDRMDV
jgi:hypothetical protein